MVFYVGSSPPPPAPLFTDEAGLLVHLPLPSRPHAFARVDPVPAPLPVAVPAAGRKRVLSPASAKTSASTPSQRVVRVVEQP